MPGTLILPQGTIIRLRSEKNPPHYQLSLELPKNMKLEVSVMGTIQLGLSNAPVEQVTYPFPTVISMQPNSNQISLDLNLLTNSSDLLSPQLLVHQLSFWGIDEYFDPQISMSRQVSTILSGTLYFIDLNGQKHELRPGEGIQLKDSTGIIRVLDIDENQILLKFHGYVQGISTQWGDHLKNLMPTWLEYLYAQHRLVLFWSAIGYLSMVVGILKKWWRVDI